MSVFHRRPPQVHVRVPSFPGRHDRDRADQALDFLTGLVEIFLFAAVAVILAALILRSL